MSLSNFPILTDGKLKQKKNYGLAIIHLTQKREASEPKQTKPMGARSRHLHETDDAHAWNET